MDPPQLFPRRVVFDPVNNFLGFTVGGKSFALTTTWSGVGYTMVGRCGNELFQLTSQKLRVLIYSNIMYYFLQLLVNLFTFVEAVRRFLDHWQLDF